MFSLYKQLLPELGGYLTHAGELSRGRLQAFMAKLAEGEADVLAARAEVGAWCCYFSFCVCLCCCGHLCYVLLSALVYHAVLCCALLSSGVSRVWQL